MKLSFLTPEWRFTVIALALVAWIAASLALPGYWYFVDTEPPLTNLQGKLVRVEVSGDRRVAVVEWKGLQSRSCQGSMRRFLVDGVIAQMPTHGIPYAHSEDIGEAVTWQERVEIPDHLRLPLHYLVELEYGCNPLQRQAAPLTVFPPWVWIPKQKD